MKASDEHALPVAIEDLPSSPRSAPSCGCLCFSFSPPKSGKKPGPARKGVSDNGDAAPGLASEMDDSASAEGRWQSVLKEVESQSVIARRDLFDAEKTREDFKLASLKEKQLVQEAQRLLALVATESM